jgi:hypothetical protein
MSLVKGVLQEKEREKERKEEKMKLRDRKRSLREGSKP